MSIPICFPPRRFVAVVFDEGAQLSPTIDALEEGHPTLRFVAAMCLYAAEIYDGARAGPYTDTDAARWARAKLLPAGEFCQLDRYEDAHLAEHFAVPIDQVTHRRADADYVQLHRAKLGLLPRNSRTGSAFRRCMMPVAIVHTVMLGPGRHVRITAAIPR